jgi:MtN3 and saliva related transmembrane protein
MKKGICMRMLDIIGIFAGTLTTVSFLPQVIKTWKLKSAKDISMGMFILFSCGLSLWIMYGIYTKSIPIIVANSITLLLAFFIIAMKLKFK